MGRLHVRINRITEAFCERLKDGFVHGPHYYRSEGGPEITCKVPYGEGHVIKFGAKWLRGEDKKSVARYLIKELEPENEYQEDDVARLFLDTAYKEFTGKEHAELRACQRDMIKVMEHYAGLDVSKPKLCFTKCDNTLLRKILSVIPDTVANSLSMVREKLLSLSKEWRQVCELGASSEHKAGKDRLPLSTIVSIVSTVI